MKNWFSKISGFFREVREEVLKCTRPSFAELRESTWIIIATMVVLGAFIFCSDMAISRVLGLMIAH